MKVIATRKAKSSLFALSANAFAGLGNPGSKYSGNRHNIGFMAIDRIAETHNSSAFRSKYQGQLSEGLLGETKTLLLKPETYMNESVNPWLRLSG